MHALSRSPISDTHFYICGSVVIDPSAAIAPGVLIQAEPGAQVLIKAGVCIGRGSIIHAVSGTLELGEGAILGAGVLAFGTCSVGAGACVGANVSLVDYEVKPGQSIPSGSVFSTLEIPAVSGQDDAVEPAQPSSSDTQNGARDTKADSTSQTNSAETSPTGNANGAGTGVEIHTAEVNVTTQQVVYGRTSLERVMAMMFPHRQSLNANPPGAEHPDSS